ncbi:MAG: PhnD/SsuA/transferrin family substrate-binding protein [Deltaproteobacteria bacterium]|nr:PhnD/SsuA/transferrin family substrate-binding protein [Deltaproteobacteria bacterium]
MPGFTFLLPPTRGDQPERRAEAWDALRSRGCIGVRRAASYEAMVTELGSGGVQVAWAPPLLCARTERDGGRVILQCVRGGSRSYRSALFTRVDGGVTLDTLSGRTVAWTDRESMAGHLLPRAFLQSRGVSPPVTFARQLFLGSLQACVRAVLEGQADLSSGYASVRAARRTRHGHEDVAGPRAHELLVLGYTEECPHDGVVLSPALAPAEADALETRFGELMQDPTAGPLLSRALEVDHLMPAAPGAFRRVLALVGEDPAA